MTPTLAASLRRRLRPDLVPPQQELPRVRAQLDGRALLGDGSEFCCQTVEISTAALTMTAPISPTGGQRIILYLEVFGGLEGLVTARTGDGFVMGLQATSPKRAKIAAQINWLLTRQMAGMDDLRGHGRITPERRVCRLLVGGDETAEVTIIDVSRRGAAVQTTAAPALGTQVVLGATRARVARTFAGGFAVEFSRLLPVEQFGPELIL